MSINRVVLTGNLTRDPELRRTQSGMAILSLRIAVNDRRKNQQTGEWEDYPNYIDCVVFGTRAESLSNYLSKGSKVGIDGKLRWSEWERDGQKRSKIEVIVDDLEFLSPRNSQGGGYQGGYQGNQGGYQSQGQNQYQAPASASASAPQSAPAIDASSSVYDDDIPF
ncbi:MAG: single-stranded DNA-binding protein [Eggerthellaceae bacterium]|nr:single-stranded DNA-binding protein [Eggerthellaceae bacterium]